jgi:hypothetical protein
MQHIAREALDVLRDPVPVHGLHGEGAKDEHLEGAREEVALGGRRHR